LRDDPYSFDVKWRTWRIVLSAPRYLLHGKIQALFLLSTFKLESDTTGLHTIARWSYLRSNCRSNLAIFEYLKRNRCDVWTIGKSNTFFWHIKEHNENIISKKYKCRRIIVIINFYFWIYHLYFLLSLFFSEIFM